MIHSLDDFKKKDVPPKDDKKKTTDSYTGGKSSGIAIENPDDDWIKKLQDKKLDNKENFDKTKNKITLKVYKNGFIIDDGEFRDLKLEENKKFMSEVEKGYIPQELVNKGMKDLGIALENHKDEEYKKPIEEKKFVAFTGTGKSLSGVNTNNLKINEGVSNNFFDKNKPSVKINIRLFNGEVVSEEFNLDNSFSVILDFVKNKTGNSNFSLIRGFPPKPINEINKKIGDLGLQNEMLTQRLN
jgi:UBX domain-containing protein 1